ncbi:MAG TPA: hypothetical protein VHD63_20235, partial [Ktedonobacteraceae bacterium]|nr:hypothetical protein [Ktedonobacteraceae bacterium]
ISQSQGGLATVRSAQLRLFSIVSSLLFYHRASLLLPGGGNNFAIHRVCMSDWQSDRESARQQKKNMVEF